MPNESPEMLWNEAQTAAAIGLQKKTLNVWRARKAPHQPPYIKVGRLVRYRPSAVAAWITEQERARNG